MELKYSIINGDATPAATTLHPRWTASASELIYGTDRFGLNILPCGQRFSNGNFTNLGQYAYIKSGLLDNNLFFQNTLSLIQEATRTYSVGVSVRIMRDATTQELELPDGTIIPGDFTDNDGAKYDSVKIGSQVWITRNLATTKYYDGSVIPTNLSNAAWAADTQGAMAVYGKADGSYVPTDELDTEAKMVAAYGRLYNWYAVTNVKVLVDTTNGHHIPTNAEWTQLTDYLIGTYPDITSANVGDVLKSTRQVDSPLILNQTIISEPIGFDDFKTKLKRTKQHGVSVESSVGSLEFDGKAFELIKNAYDTDIDSELQFLAEIKCSDDADFETLYSGIIDLATYSEQQGDYCSCFANVGEIGKKTTFNNRIDTKVDIARLDTIDGETLLPYENIDKYIEIPAKSILKISKNEQSTNSVLSGIDLTGLNSIGLLPAIDTVLFNDDVAITTYGLNTTYTDPNVMPFYFKNSSAINAYLKYNLSVEILNTNIADLQCKFVVRTKFEGNFVDYKESNFIVSKNTNWVYTFIDSLLLLADRDVAINIIFSLPPYETANPVFSFTTKANSTISVERLETLQDTFAPVSLIHETLSRLSEIYAGMTVKSDLYGRTDSEINPTLINGGGALKSITTGMKLRDARLVDGSYPKLETSFKDMIQNLTPIDNIGWGFDGDFVRVENWKWFYNDNVILTITNPANKKRQLIDSVPTRLKSGYAKYGGESDINSIDTFHTNREYTTKIKAIDELNTQVSKFIADPYLIEFTRRKALEKTTKDWKYDEDLFVFALKSSTLITMNLFYDPFSDIHILLKNYYDLLTVGDVIVVGGIDRTITEKYDDGFYFGIKATPDIPSGNQVATFDNSPTLEVTVDIGVEDADSSIISPETLINYRISPARNAIRFADSMFPLNSPITELALTAGAGNVTAYGKPKTETDYNYLEDANNGDILLENSNVPKQTQLLKPEIISFEYPLTPAEIASVKTNPYGIIEVDGEECYLSEIIMQPLSGMCDFKLIPKI